MQMIGRGQPFDEFIRAYPSLEAMVGGFASTNLPVVIADARAIDLPIIYANAAFCDLTGYDLLEILGRNCRFLQGPETDPESVIMIRQAIANATPIAIDLLNYRKDGTAFWNALSMAPVMGVDGKPQYYFSCQLDASARRQRMTTLEQKNTDLENDVSQTASALRTSTETQARMLDEKSLLIHELHHRVRNNLQMMSALIGIQSSEAPDKMARSVLSRLRMRVDALAALHRRLHQLDRPVTFDLRDFLQDHIPDLVSAFSNGNVALELSSPPVLLKNEIATAVALIINELATQALRSVPNDVRGAALSIRVWPGTRGVSISVTGSYPERSAQAVPHACNVEGRLIEALIRQIRGTISFPIGNAAFAAQLHIPIEA